MQILHLVMPVEEFWRLKAGSNTGRSEFRRACVFPKNQADGEAILLRKAELHIGLGGGRRTATAALLPHYDKILEL